MFPAVLQFSNRKALQSSQLLDVCRAAEKFEEGRALDDLAAWRNLQWLSRFKEWAIFAFVACPGIAIFPELTSATSCLCN